jgi:hypothetical protein
MEKYCKNMLKGGTWGGQMEMNALAHVYKFNAIVHQVDNPNMVQQFHEPMGSVPTIHLSYHLGRHYNSVRREDDPMLPKTKPLPIGHDLEKVRILVKSSRITKEEKLQIRVKSEKVYQKAFCDSLADNLHGKLSWLGLEKEAISLTAKHMHETVKVFDKTKKIQKMLNLVGEDSSSSEEEEEEPVIDTIKLKK